MVQDELPREVETTRFRKNTIFLAQLLIISFTALLGTRISDLLLDRVTASGISIEELQIADSVFQFIIAFSTIVWGLSIDRFTDRRVLLFVVGNCVWITGSFLLFFTPTSLSMVFTVEILWAIGIGALGPIIASFLGDIFAIERRGRLFSLYTIFLYIIKGSAIAVTGLLGSLANNWKFPSGLFGILGLMVILIFVKYGRAPSLASAEPEISSSNPEHQTVYSATFRLEIGDLWQIIRKPSNALFLIQGISGMIGVTIVTRYLNYWFTSSKLDGFGLSTAVAVLILGMAGAIGALLGITAAGWFIDRNFKRGKPQNALWFATICVFAQVGVYFLILQVLPEPADLGDARNDLIQLLGKYPFFLYFLICFNIAVFFSTPIGTTVSTARTHLNLPEHRGTAAALFDTTDFIGAGIGLLLGAVFLGITDSYRLVVQLGTLFWLISGIIWLGLTRTFGLDYLGTRQVLTQRGSQLTGEIEGS